MRIPDSLRSLALVAPALLVAACSGNTAVQPFVAVGGWSWAPDEAGDKPLPVVWLNDATPQRLPLPPAGNCPSSGAVMAMAARNGQPLAGGIAVRCNDDVPTVLPVVWTSMTTFQVQQLPDRTLQGTVMAVAFSDGSVYAAGAVGFQSPEPAIWVNGVARIPTPLALIPDGHDAAIITAIIPTPNYVAATGIAHVTGSAPPEYTAVGWVFDPELRFPAFAELLLPFGVDATTGPAVYLTIEDVAGVNDIPVTTAAMVSTATPTSAGVPAQKPVVWNNDSPYTPFGTSLQSGPFASPTSITMVASTPYSSGFVRTPSLTSRPQPAVWSIDAETADGVLDVLPTVDSATALGAAEGLAVFNGTAWVAGESCQPHPNNRALVVCPPMFWANDGWGTLSPLAPAGGSAEVTNPTFGWWRVPGTPSTDPPDWPFPGGFPEILGSASVAAGGSGVARAIVALPPGP